MPFIHLHTERLWLLYEHPVPHVTHDDEVDEEGAQEGVENGPAKTHRRGRRSGNAGRRDDIEFNIQYM